VSSASDRVARRLGFGSVRPNALTKEPKLGATRTYTIILEPAEEGGFVVHVPALPEVCTEGETEEEALAMAREAIELVLIDLL